ncbi:MAG: radical SAM protein [Candidatus Eisenbacteria bacterium]|nr:hypothetical protein [Candidatus Eisenbacteria bacterium]
MSLPSITHAVTRAGFHSLNHILSRTPSAPRRQILRCLPLHLLERRPPRLLMIEATNACNLHCPLCPVGAGVMTRPRGYMEIEPYRKLIREVSPFVSRILMNFAGETLLHPQIVEMVRFASERAASR